MSVRKGGQLIAGSVDPDKYANISLTNSPYTTNRILEIPQNIKLELNNGTLTLKAGSKVYVPNGFEADGTTPKFDIITIESDKTTTLSGYTGKFYCSYVKELDNIFCQNISESGSGTSPTGALYYNTSTNIIDANQGYHYSFPLSENTANGTQLASIDQVFNGFGYIGSTVFALPGVKYEYSIDVNPDGSYVNQIWTNPSVKLFTTSNTSTLYSSLTLRIDPTTNVAGNLFVDAYGYHYTAYTPYKYPSVGTAYWFNPATGKTITISSSGVVGTTAYGILSFGIYRNAGKIDWIEDISINSVNTYSRSELSGLGMPSGRYIDLTLGASGSTYTAPANGWFAFYCGSVCDSRIATKGGLFGNTALGKSGFANNNTVSVLKGDTVTLMYSSSTDVSLRFYYCEGEN